MICKNFKILLVIAIACLGFFYFQNINAQELININTATQSELENAGLYRIGSVTSQKIVDYREANGPFKKIEDIINVSGIGQVTFDKIKNNITVGDVFSVEPPVEELPSAESLPTEAPPQTAESELEGVAEEESNDGEDGDVKYSLGQIVINEFVSDPADGEVEFIELYNNLNKNIDLSDWAIYEGSGAKTAMSGTIGGNGSARFFVLEKPNGNLNNSGDAIILKWQEVMIDRVSYGNWDDGNVDNNAPASGDPKSVARYFDGANTFNNQNDFSETSVITKGGSNIITDFEELDNSSLSVGESYNYSADIIISEVFPNPFGRDDEAEFIELFNKGEKVINLEGWALSDSGNKKYEVRSKNLEDIKVKPQEYLVFYRTDTRIALNNSGGDEVRLFQPGQDISLQVLKYDTAPAGQSYILTQIDADYLQINTDYRWAWSETPTPGAQNIITAKNHAPEVSFSISGEQRAGQILSFDSSDTTDIDGDELFFNWDFGGRASSTQANPIYIFLTPGIFEIILKVSDGEDVVENKKTVNISSIEDDITLPRLQSEIGSNNVIISELLPNPAGLDAEGEWIEIKNKSAAPINLDGWKLDDSEGGSSPFTFADTVIAPNGFLILDRVDTNIALNNTTDDVRLFDNFANLVDEVVYSGVKENLSYARNGEVWQWSAELTPGAENVLSQNFSVSTANVGGIKISSNQKYQGATETTLARIRDYEKGDLVKVSGTVAVQPGILGTQYFYIVSVEGALANDTENQLSGIQVYNSKKLFPDLEVGDVAEVTGEISENYGERRLNTKILTDIEKLATSTPPRAVIIEADKIGEDLEGSLVSVTGEVVERKTSTVWLDDGNREVVIYIKNGTGINKSNITEGEIITVVGLVSQSNDIYRILPRSPEDIIPIVKNQAGQVLGEISVNDVWSLAQNNKRLRLIQYLLIISLGLIVVLGFLLWREKKK